MCNSPNVENQIGNILQVMEPSLDNVLEILNQNTSPSGEAAIAAYDAMAESLLNWKKGDDSTIAIEAVQTFISTYNAVSTAVPIPIQVTALVNTVAAAAVLLLGILKANTPTTDNNLTQHSHEESTIMETTARVKVLLPDLYHESVFTRARAELGDDKIAAKKLTEVWNKAVAQAGPDYEKYTLAAPVAPTAVDEESPDESKIKERAHELWKEDGEPMGKSAYYWEKAKQEVEGTKPAK